MSCDGELNKFATKSIVYVDEIQVKRLLYLFIFLVIFSMCITTVTDLKEPSIDILLTRHAHIIIIS